MEYRYAEWTLARREEMDKTFGKRLSEAIELVKTNARPVNLSELQAHIDKYKFRRNV